MNNHTPGPWVVESPEIYGPLYGSAVCDLGDDGWRVVALEANPYEYEPEADAWLIAAAPELLEAAERVVALELNEINGNVVDESAHDLARTQAVESLIHIVAKAKGER